MSFEYKVAIYYLVPPSYPPNEDGNTEHIEKAAARLEEFLNKLGLEGWEMANAADGVGAVTFFFKREVE